MLLGENQGTNRYMNLGENQGINIGAKYSKNIQNVKIYYANILCQDMCHINPLKCEDVG